MTGEQQTSAPAGATVVKAMKTVIQTVVTDRDSALTLLIDSVEDAVKRLERATDDIFAALPPGACEHDAPQWADALSDIMEDLRTAASMAKQDASDAVNELFAAINAREAKDTPPGESAN